MSLTPTPIAAAATTAVSSGTSQALTTSVTIPAGATIFLVLCCRGGAGVALSTAGGGLTWVTDRTSVRSASNQATSIIRAEAPQGLASGTTITVTLDIAATRRGLFGWYVTGLDGAGPVDQAADNPVASGHPSVTSPATTRNRELVMVASTHAAASGADTATDGGYGLTQLWDQVVGSSVFSECWAAYKTVTTVGAQTGGFTAADTTGASTPLVVTYKSLEPAPLADLDALRAAILSPRARRHILRSFPAIGNDGIFVSGWTASGTQDGTTGAAPTTQAAPTRSTVGAWLPELTDVGSLWLAEAMMTATMTAGNISRGELLLYDRLSHQGGLSGTVTTAQTTNLDTAALTRYINGVGVFIMLEVYSAVGTTATTVVVSYTNTAGVSGRTTKAVVFGGSGNRETGFCTGPLPLQAGDVGVLSVQSVTVTASTLTAGAFGVTLGYPLAWLSAGVDIGQGGQWDGLAGGGLAAIREGACLNGILWQKGTIGAAPLLQLGLSVARS